MQRVGMAKSAEQMQPAIGKIAAELSVSPVLHAGETGIRYCAQCNGCMW